MDGLDFVVAAPAELSVQWGFFPLFNRTPIGSASTETSYWGQPVHTCGSLFSGDGVNSDVTCPMSSELPGEAARLCSGQFSSYISSPNTVLSNPSLICLIFLSI